MPTSHPINQQINNRKYQNDLWRFVIRPCSFYVALCCDKNTDIHTGIQFGNQRAKAVSNASKFITNEQRTQQIIFDDVIFIQPFLLLVVIHRPNET